MALMHPALTAFHDLACCGKVCRWQARRSGSGRGGRDASSNGASGTDCCPCFSGAIGACCCDRCGGAGGTGCCACCHGASGTGCCGGEGGF